MKKINIKNKNNNSIKRIFVLMVLVSVSLFFISACNKDNILTPVHYQNFHTGTKGITMGFVRGMPPVEIYQGTDFNIALEIMNGGAWDTNGLKVALGGFNPKMVDIRMDPDPDPDVQIASENDDLLMRFNKVFAGKSVTGTRGSYKLITASATKVMPPDIGDNYDINLVATACYGYKTEASIDVCIAPQREEPGVTQQKKACAAKSSYKLSGGQGAPVAVTKVDYEMLSVGEKRTIRMKIYLENLGKGNVYDQHEYYKLCSALANDPIQDSDFGIINVAASMSGKEIDCNPFSPQKDFNLKLGKSEDNFALCELDVPEGSFTAYNSIFTITASYGYVDTISTKVKVKKLYGPEAG